MKKRLLSNPKIEKQPQKSKGKQGFNIEQHSIE
jgi:hypothetical protein